MSAALVIAIIVAINLVGQEFHFRLDLTEDREYTLSPATRDILNNLEDVVTVKAYFSENLPAQYLPVRQGFQETLLEYAAQSDGKLVFEFVNPNAGPAQEEEAAKAGIQQLMIEVREKDQMKQQKSFMGAVVSVGDASEPIPVVQPGSAAEYALSKAIKKLSTAQKPLIGFLQGHGEAPLSELIEVRENLEVMYKLEDVMLTDSTGIPAVINTLAVVRPTDSIPPSHLDELDRFLARGGRMLVAFNRVEGNLQTGMGEPVNTGLENWLKDKGVEAEENFILDAQCASVGYQQQTSFGMITRQLQFPYMPIIATYAKHPITEGLEMVIMQFASNLKFTGDSKQRFTPIAFSSEQSSTERAPVMLNPDREWTEADFPQKFLPVAGVLEGNLGGNQPTKMVIVADGDFPVNGPPQQARRLRPDNVNLFVNGIDWLSDDTGLIDLRTKGASSRPIRQLEDATKTTIKYINFLLPVLLAVGYGIFRMQRSRSLRLKRQEENFDNE